VCQSDEVFLKNRKEKILMLGLNLSVFGCCSICSVSFYRIHFRESLKSKNLFLGLLVGFGILNVETLCFSKELAG
jgi:hypothetical protein